MILGAVAALVGAGAAIASAPATSPFAQADTGHDAAECFPPDPTPDRGMIGPALQSSPPPAEAHKLVEAFIAASAAGDSRSLSALAAPEWLTTSSARTCIAAIAVLPATCPRSDPYLLGDGQIRVEWVCGSRIAYSLFFTLSDGRVSKLWSVDATDHVEVARRSDPHRSEIFAIMVDELAETAGRILALPEERRAHAAAGAPSDANRRAAEEAAEALVVGTMAGNPAMEAIAIHALQPKLDLTPAPISATAASEIVAGCTRWHAEDLGSDAAAGRDYFLVRLFCPRLVHGWNRVYLGIAASGEKVDRIYLNQGTLVRAWKPPER